MLSKSSRVLERKPSAWPVNTLVPRLSTMRALIPQRAIQYDAIRPDGPAPMMSLSSILGSLSEICNQINFLHICL